MNLNLYSFKLFIYFLQLVQRFSTRSVRSLRDITYRNRFRDVGLVLLKFIRLREYLIYLYKLFNEKAGMKGSRHPGLAGPHKGSPISYFRGESTK